ncbi:hypothetical protein MTR67_036591 [Solanum verrucosum]|uniref:Uncharacterized protein n=1 Tax=Solanum verrucosum TaxID=315347 RepID=A0AAF0UCK2_SOLVR|nr:hypothetical protein MTR67_036591 [Solanum verrucosum]
MLPLKSSHVICSHDGLVLLHSPDAYNTFVLCNPSIRQHKIIVCPYINNYSSIVASACGLCYDSTTDDYKIIFIYVSYYLVCYANKNLWMVKETIPILDQSLKEGKINYSWLHQFIGGHFFPSKCVNISTSLIILQL